MTTHAMSEKFGSCCGRHNSAQHWRERSGLAFQHRAMGSGGTTSAHAGRVRSADREASRPGRQHWWRRFAVPGRHDSCAWKEPEVGSTWALHSRPRCAALGRNGATSPPSARAAPQRRRLRDAPPLPPTAFSGAGSGPQAGRPPPAPPLHLTHNAPPPAPRAPPVLSPQPLLLEGTPHAVCLRKAGIAGTRQPLHSCF